MLVYSNTTLVRKDEYTCECLNDISKNNIRWSELKVGVSPVPRRCKRVKYKDANWMP